MSPFLPPLYLLPPIYLFCLLLVNVVIHYATLEDASSLPWAFLSMIVPRPPSSAPLPAARRLLVVNVAVNTLIHALLWAALTGACSQVIIIFTSFPLIEKKDWFDHFLRIFFAVLPRPLPPKALSGLASSGKIIN